MEVGEKVRRVRERAEMSLNRVAVVSGGAITPQALSIIERGKADPQLTSLRAIARGLDATITITPHGAVTITRSKR
jgi:transcriptional regulator with XRE-family HTH domain